MAQLLKVLAALAENPGLVSSTHITAPNYTTPGPGTRCSLWPCGHCMHLVLFYAGKHANT